MLVLRRLLWNWEESDMVEIVALESVCSFNRGRTITAKNAVKGEIPVIAGGQAPSYYHNEPNRIGESITIAGSGAYAGFVSYWNQPIYVSDAFTVDPSEKLIHKYLFHWLKMNQQKIFLTQKGAGVPHVHGKDIANFQIPIPTIEVQTRIVEILDTFTSSISNLKEQIKERRKQYEYYRDQLLDLEGKDGVEMKTLGEVAKYRRGSFPQPYGNEEWYNGEGALPFVQVADVEENGMKLKDLTKQFISTLAMPMSVFVPQGSIVVTLQGSIGKVAITQYDSYVDRTLGIFTGFLINIDKKYFAHQLLKIFSIKKKKARGGTIKTITKEEFSQFAIPIPSKEEQLRIVSILDQFEASIANLEAQLKEREKQYEYYRNQLLTFE